MALEGYRKLRFRWWRRHLLARRRRRGDGHRRAAPAGEARAERTSDDAYGFTTLTGQMSDHAEPSRQEAHATLGSPPSDPEDVVVGAGDRAGDSPGGPRGSWQQPHTEAEKKDPQESRRVPGIPPFWAAIYDRIGPCRGFCPPANIGDV